MSVLGHPATRQQSTTLRLDFLVAITRAIRRRGWRDLDALVFPAGFLRTAHWFAPLSQNERRSQLEDSDVGEIARVALNKLEESSAGCLAILGIDTNRHLPWGFRGDQAVAAFTAAGCEGVVRKIFPVDGDTNEWGRAPYLLDHQDAIGSDRFIVLPNGQRSMIAVCYDAFALPEIALGPTDKLRAMRFRTDDSDGWRAFDQGEARAWIEQLREQIARQRPTVLLNPIHRFSRPGAEIFWQRHGMASASSFLDGALCVGAAHFGRALPDYAQATLTADRVPRDHLRAGNLRRSHMVSPVDGFVLRNRSAPRHPALIRLFQQ